MQSPCINCEHIDRDKNDPGCVACARREALADQMAGVIRVRVKKGKCRICGAPVYRDILCRACRVEYSGTRKKDIAVPKELINFEKERINALYGEGASVAEIADLLKIGTTQVANYLGVGRRNLVKLTNKAIKEIIRRYRNGETRVAIAKDYGVSAMTIGTLLRRKGAVKNIRYSPDALEDYKRRTRSMRDIGMTYAAISRELGVSVFIVQRYGAKKRGQNL